MFVMPSKPKLDVEQPSMQGKIIGDTLCFYLQVKMGEGWVTQQGFWSFLNQGELVIYACLHPDGAIYDVTELSVCQGMLDSGAFRQLGVDCCKVWLHFGNPDAARQRQRYQAPQEPPAGGRKNKRPKGRRRR